MSTFLSKIVSLRPVAMGLAAGLLVAGVLAIVGGSYAHDVVHRQLAPQQIFFPKDKASGLPDDLASYAGQQVTTGDAAKAYAEDFIGLHLKEIGGGKTYSQVSSAAMQDPKNTQLAEQTATLFRGETLRGLLLSAWGWGTVGTVALIAGWVLVALGAILFLLPACDWFVNGRKKPAPAA